MAPFLVDPVSTFMLSARNAQSDRGNRKRTPLWISFGTVFGVVLIFVFLVFLWCCIKKRREAKAAKQNYPTSQTGCVVDSNSASDNWHNGRFHGSIQNSHEFYDRPAGTQGMVQTAQGYIPGRIGNPGHVVRQISNRVPGGTSDEYYNWNGAPQQPSVVHSYRSHDYRLR